jgi:hypothetical protein
MLSSGGQLEDLEGGCGNREEPLDFVEFGETDLDVPVGCLGWKGGP